VASWLSTVLPSLPYLQVSGEYLIPDYLVGLGAGLVVDVPAYLAVLNATAPLEVQDKKSANR